MLTTILWLLIAILLLRWAWSAASGGRKPKREDRSGVQGRGRPARPIDPEEVQDVRFREVSEPGGESREGESGEGER
jgi:hypothetical protein